MSSTTRWSDVVVEVDEPSKVASSRRAARALGRAHGLDDPAIGRLDLMVTEAATNQLRHAGRGLMVLAQRREASASWIEMLALDRGPGIRRMGHALAGGRSAEGGLGQGLGAIRRLADHFSIFAPPERGTALLARIGGPSTETPLPCSGLAFAKRGETVCGDAWSSRKVQADKRLLLVLDGVGHGHDAHEAVTPALRRLHDARHAEPEQLLSEVHGELAGSRGAAGLAALVDPRGERLRYASVGNLRATVVDSTRQRAGLVSLDGTLGLGRPVFRGFDTAWSPGSTLVVQTDGVSGRWRTDDHRGLWHQDPALISGVLLRDHAWRHDDATVVALRHRREAPT